MADSTLDYEARLKELAALEDNWDTYGSEAPNAPALEMALRFLRLLEEEGMNPDRVVPSAEGGVAVCFLRDGKYYDIEFYNDGGVCSVDHDPKRGNEIQTRELGPPDFRAEIARVKEFYIS